MSCQSKNLNVLAYANGFTLWHYTTEADTLADVIGAGYFNEAADCLRRGDMIFVITHVYESPGAGQFIVSSNEDDGVVRIAEIGAVPVQA